MFNIFPWQTLTWNFLLKSYQKDRIPHAFLFEGAEGLGKAQFARAFAELLLCQGKDLTKACGHCRSCELLKTPLHPDLTCIAGEGKNRVIKIDQIRELNAHIFNTAHFKGYRVIIIEAAHTMNQAASNALLKILEEPPSQVVFLLLTHSPHKISATVRSRSQKINFQKPCFSEIKLWLEEKLTAHSFEKYSSEFLFSLAQESPIRALALIENDELSWRENIIADFSQVISGTLNPLGLAEKYQELALDKLFFWIKTVVVDLIRLKSDATKRIIHSDQLKQLQTAATHCALYDLHTYMDKLYELDHQVAYGTNLNHGLVVDNIFCGILNLSRSQAR